MIKIRESFIGFKQNYEVIVFEEYMGRNINPFIYSRHDTEAEAKKSMREYTRRNK